MQVPVFKKFSCVIVSNLLSAKVLYPSREIQVFFLVLTGSHSPSMQRKIKTRKQQQNNQQLSIHEIADICYIIYLFMLLLFSLCSSLITRVVMRMCFVCIRNPLFYLHGNLQITKFNLVPYFFLDFNIGFLKPLITLILIKL